MKIEARDDGSNTSRSTNTRSSSMSHTSTERNQMSDIKVDHFPLHKPAVSRYKAISEHLCCDLNGEAVILNLKSGKYYGLNGVGSRIWDLVQTPISPSEIERVIFLEYDVAIELCQRQVSEFLKQMLSEELIEIVNETGIEIY
jgi:hypothetical protein